ncbi:unannotated protein [freshwater metagenome]|uniref:Unannotated protein n=1 Tax=freshwater metagenome TaxID=449393 RepID=A0A6J6FN29_9ZZZZ
MARALSVPQKRSPAVKPARRVSPKKVTTRTAKQRQEAKTPRLRRVTSLPGVTTKTRRIVVVGTLVAGLVIAFMLVVVIFQTRIAERQLGIDKVESQISIERQRYDALRLERSSLRNPERLVAEATAMGMVPGQGTDFTAVDPMTMALVLVSTGGVDPKILALSHDPFENYGAVKATVGDRP